MSVYELVDHDAEVNNLPGMTGNAVLTDMAQDIAERILERLISDEWKILTWDDETLAPRGWDVTWAAPTFLLMGLRMGLGDMLAQFATDIPIRINEYQVCNALFNCDGAGSDWSSLSVLYPPLGVWSLFHCDAFSEGCGDNEPADPWFIPLVPFARI